MARSKSNNGHSNGEIVVHTGENQVIATITKEAVEEFDIKVGYGVTTLVKLTSVRFKNSIKRLTTNIRSVFTLRMLRIY